MTNNRKFGLVRLIWLICIFIFISFNLAIAKDGRKRMSATSTGSSDSSDVEAEIKFGRELSARILGNYKLLKDEKVNKYINLVGKGMAMYAGRPELKYYFAVLDTKETNAFAAPGGYVFITKGALDKMENEAQLASVIGHELGHIIKKHVVNELNIKGEDTSAMGGLATMIDGTTSSFRAALDQALDQAFDILHKRGYKVEDELEADEFGILLSYISGYDPTALKVFLKKAKSFEKEDTTYKGDHPIHKVRMDKIDKVLKANGLQNVSLAKGEERFKEYVRK